jgi:hypothetical protein
VGRGVAVAVGRRVAVGVGVGGGALPQAVRNPMRRAS